jgi:hypothetical protein
MDTEEFLEHYGVKGMKWGVRNERKPSGGSNGTTKSNKPQAKAGVVDPATVYFATLLAAQGGLSAARLVDSGNARVLVKKGARAVTLNTNGPQYKKNDALAAKNLSEKQLMDTVVKDINPNYGSFGTKMNCRRCTLSYEMRRRGFDVAATHSIMATGQDGGGLKKAANTKTTAMDWGENKIHSNPTGGKVDSVNIITKSLEKQPNGSRGEVSVSWAVGGGHSIAYEVVRGKPMIIDTQRQTHIKTQADWDKAYPFNPSAIYYTRLDDKPLNTNWLERWVKDNA